MAGRYGQTHPQTNPKLENHPPGYNPFLGQVLSLAFPHDSESRQMPHSLRGLLGPEIQKPLSQ